VGGRAAFDLFSQARPQERVLSGSGSPSPRSSSCRSWRVERTLWPGNSTVGRSKRIQRRRRSVRILCDLAFRARHQRAVRLVVGRPDRGARYSCLCCIGRWRTVDYERPMLSLTGLMSSLSRHRAAPSRSGQVVDVH
jgi:hypothetical protein